MTQRTFDIALLLTAVIVIALVGLNWFGIDTLASRDWCAQIMAAEKFTGDAVRTDVSTVKLVLTACRDVLLHQLESVGWIAKILAGALAISVLVMYVVKFAGGSADVNVGGNSLRVGPGAAAVAEVADRVVDAAKDERDHIVEEVAADLPKPAGWRDEP